jgi:hypothetical protein
VGLCVCTYHWWRDCGARSHIAGAEPAGSLDGQTNSGARDAFLIKYDANGNRAWTRLLGSSSNDEARALTTGTDGAIYMAGSTEGSLDGQTNRGFYDAFLTKIQRQTVPRPGQGCWGASSW